jgi:hypothetical protein
MSSIDDIATMAAGAAGDDYAEIDEDDDEYVEAEPVLAYSRMENKMDITQITQDDAVSCIKADHKVNHLTPFCRYAHSKLTP